MEKNTLIVVQGHQHPWLLSQALVADDLSWTGPTAPAFGGYSAKTRYRQADAACALHPDTPAAGHCRVEFAQPQWAVTPGQSLVLYDGEVCLGGGVIAASEAWSPGLER